MALFQIIYMSSLVTDEPAILPPILEVAVRSNKQRNITGMLLYADGNILQVLEGEKAVLVEAFRSIQSDVRHHGIFVLIEEDITVRRFSSWSMGFKHLSPADLAKFPTAAHVFKAHPDEISVRVRPSDAQIILESFAEGSMGIV